MLSIYPAIFQKEKTGEYSVIFPDLNHLATCGSDLNEAMSMAVDCLAGYLYSEQLDGNNFPTPTPIDKIDIHCEDDEDSDYIEAFVYLVSVDVAEYARQHFTKSVKKTLTIPQWLNDEAKRRNINFSKVLQVALMNEIKIHNIQ